MKKKLFIILISINSMYTFDNNNNNNKNIQNVLDLKKTIIATKPEKEIKKEEKYEDSLFNNLKKTNL